MTDIEIANNTKKVKITTIAKKIGLKDNFELYGSDKAKINFSKINPPLKGQLILVTSINPTPYGEGKTTVSIGLNDALNKLGKTSIAALREPSMGPVFGLKGGATGGGYSQVIPMEDINLHFTGDFHALTSANNLIAAALDNHLHFGNDLQIDKEQIFFKRCLDVNDRALRDINLKNRKESFNITAASELMSILCLSTNFSNLKRRLANIMVAYNEQGNPIYTKDLKVDGALAVILKDALKPNLVQSLEHNPVFLHGGPFANVSTGCSSIIATNLGLKLANYVITEAGFGSDLGAEKFFDIKCRLANLKPSCVVIVATLKALKHHGGASLEEITQENLSYLKKGLANLQAHITNIENFTKNIVVCLNQYQTDTQREIEVVKDFTSHLGYKFALTTNYKDGGVGAISLAKEVLEVTRKPNDFQYLYPIDLSLTDKINTICQKVYHARKVNYPPQVLTKLQKYESLGFKNYPICIAKTPYSLSDDEKKLGYPKDYEITLKDVNIYTGAEFLCVYLGKIMTMPGLPQTPNYENITIDDEGHIKGLF